MKQGILIAFGELFLKSLPVRHIFIKKLITNISYFLKKENLVFKIYHQRERVFIENDNKKAIEIIKNIFGISWFAKAFFFEKLNLEEISNFIAKNYKNWLKKEDTFAIRLKKGDEVQITTKKIIDEFVHKIKRKVNLGRPKKEIFIEARKEGWYLYFKKIKGAGGLPTGSGGKVLALISGGIDSPVASFLMAKRGAENIWIHFHSFPLTSNKSIEKIQDLAKIFLKFQPKLKIYLFPFSKIQIEVRTKIEAKYRILIYRRIMLKIAQKIAQKENCFALVTGENMGQVSSQTLPNIRIIQNKISLPILRPLIGMDKEEIINLAKKIGTFPISIKFQEDCCTLFVPKHVTAEGNLKIIRELEQKLKLQKLIESVIKEIKILYF